MSAWSSTSSSGGRRLLLLYLAGFVVFLYAPTIVLLIFSVNDARIPAFPLSGFTTRWYEQFFANDELRASAVASVKVAFMTATISTTLGVVAAFGVTRGRFRGRAAANSALILPLVVPYVVMGIGLLVFFNTLQMQLSLLTVAAGHIVITTPYAFLSIVPRILSLDKSLEEASRDLGASALFTFIRISLPLMAPAVAAAFIMSFVVSMDEYPIASFVVGTQATLPVYLFGQLRYPDQLPQIIAVAAFIQLISLAAVVAAELLRRRA